MLFRSTMDPMTVTLEEAIELLQKKQEAEAQKHIKKFEEEPELEILNGSDYLISFPYRKIHKSPVVNWELMYLVGQMLMPSCKTTGAVSYTHLDVYKRQIRIRSITERHSLFLLSYTCTPFGFHGCQLTCHFYMTGDIQAYHVPHR